MLNKTVIYLGSLVLLQIFLTSCNPYNKDFRKFYYDELSLLQSKNNPDSAYLKAHDYEGRVYIFAKDWVVDTLLHQVSGKGTLYSAERKIIQSGQLQVASDSIVLFETNYPLDNTTSDFLGPKVIISMANIILAGLCISVPKACFGSCPTYYVTATDNVFETKAESFSSAIAPCLEYRDIDDMRHQVPGSTSFTLIMKNEALETHAVNHVRLLAFPDQDGKSRVLHSTDDTFFTTEKIAEPHAVKIGTSILPSILIREDSLEWTSLADEESLVKKEVMFIEFRPETIKPGSLLGLELTFRQTLMTTYLLYHALSYMGDEYSDLLYEMETSGKLGQNVSKSMLHALGSIEVYSLDKNKNWIFEGKFYETGPIAKNNQLCVLERLKLKNSDTMINLKLVYNKGLWRFDKATLVEVGNMVSPVIISPSTTFKNKVLLSKSQHINESEISYFVSMPGDMYEFSFDIPSKNSKYQLFLDSQGYYLEWMRAHWRQDKDIPQLYSLLRNPVKWLNNQTSSYKFYENLMETEFIESRIHQERAAEIPHLLVSKSSR